MLSGLFLGSIVDINAEAQFSDPFSEDVVLKHKWVGLQKIPGKHETALRNVCQCRTLRFISAGDNCGTACLVGQQLSTLNISL